MTHGERQRRDAEHARYIRSPEAFAEALSTARGIDAALHEGTRRRLNLDAPVVESPWLGYYEAIADRVARTPVRRAL